MLDESASRQLTRMFRDPRALEPAEHRELIARMREAVELAPHVAEVKVLLGMALSVDLQAQDALETLRAAARQALDCSIAPLKLGELLMRLRIGREAEEEKQAFLRTSRMVHGELDMEALNSIFC